MDADPVDPPIVRGDRFLLRPFAEEDVPSIVEAGADDYISLITTVPSGGDATTAYEFIQRQWQRPKDGAGYSFAVAPARGGPAVGQVGVWVCDLKTSRRVNLGYWVLRSQRGQGVASDALALATDWAQSALGAVRCQAFIEPWNAGSWRAAERVGYEREGLLRKWQQVDGDWRDFYVYSATQR